MVSQREFRRTVTETGAVAGTADRPALDSDFIGGPFLVDGHVHYYPNFDRDRFLDSALANFRRAACTSGTRPEYAGWLLFAESAGMHYFRAFRDAVGQATGGAWTFQGTDEAESLVARRDVGAKLVLIAGRQIITAEGLEVLALCCDTEVDDGQPLATVVGAASRLDAIVVLPWAFGKWWFRRGDLIDRFVKSAEPSRIFLGDNGGRARLGPRPRPFRVAESRGIAILPGSDPFPLNYDAKRIGKYGFAIEGTMERSRPAAGLKHLLRHSARPPSAYGCPIGIIGFCVNQLLIRLNRQRIRVRPAAPGR